jgi:arylsulfatase
MDNKMNKIILSRWLLIGTAILVGSASIGRSADTRPNILLIVADDLGYTDLGAYGGEIQTPNIDQIAREGLLFTQFHTSPLCAPTRAMLMSGNNNHVAGMARMHAEGLLGGPMRGYENSLSDRIVPFPELLQQAGYNTFTAGKWHLGIESENRPNTAGFTRSWNLLHGGVTISTPSVFLKVDPFTQKMEK